MKMFKKEEGFTLIELMVVVLIIGILVAIAIPVFNGAKANAAKRSCFANERTVEGSCRTYEASEGALPAGVWTVAGPDLVAKGYLKSVPSCPAGGTYTYTAATGTLGCAGANGVAGDHGHY